ncbi:hypothetical protein [Mesorhizobium sp. M0488]|uniref:hypothetical protein n=1 Tax=unclassified Mesorhizobium TaxID=325217 RepID=UPI00333B2F94
MHGSIMGRCRRLALGSASALVLTLAPYQIALHGSAAGIHVASAQAAPGGGNGGNGGGGGGGGSGGNSGNSGNSGGNSGTNGGSGAGKGQNNNGKSHVDATTRDRVDVQGNEITVHHPDGITEKIENGRFRMEDALGRTIIDRRATPADVSRLKSL